jgi:predicted transcriptional regulator
MAEETKSATPEEKPQLEKQTNCLGCGKPIKKLKRYYRNGKFYCSKRCWQKTKKPKSEEK